jgi:hypothetical protein
MSENHPLVDYGMLNQKVGYLIGIYEIQRETNTLESNSNIFESAGRLIAEKQALKDRLGGREKLILKPSLDELERKCLELQEAYK